MISTLTPAEIQAQLEAAGEARKLLRAVLEHLAPVVEYSERYLPLRPTTDHPVIAEIRAFLKRS